MRFVRYVLLICLGVFLLYAKLTSPSASSTPAPVSGTSSHGSYLAAHDRGGGPTA